LSPEFLGIAAVACWLAVVVATALLVRRRWPEQREWSRKVVHLGTGPVVLIAWAMGIGQGVALPAAALVTVLTALNHRYRLLPAVADVGRHSYGTIAYGAAITILLALFWPQQPLPVAAGVLVMALGDGLAGLIGPQIPSIRWQVLGQTKSLAGTGAMAAASLLALGGLTALASGLGLAAPSWPSLLLLTGVATGLEQLSRYGGDNLTVPLATGMLWQQLSG
jgi:phytol kinase